MRTILLVALLVASPLLVAAPAAADPVCVYATCAPDPTPAVQGVLDIVTAILDNPCGQFSSPQGNPCHPDPQMPECWEQDGHIFCTQPRLFDP